MPAVHQLRPALLVALCSFSGQAVLWWPQPMSCTAHPDASGRALKVHLRSNVKPVYRAHNLSVGNAKKHSQSRIKPHDDNNKSPVALFCQKQFKAKQLFNPPCPLLFLHRAGSRTSLRKCNPATAGLSLGSTGGQAAVKRGTKINVVIELMTGRNPGG